MNNSIIMLETSMGKIKIELWEDQAPVTVKNFLRYCREGFYEGTIFHKAIDNFMIYAGLLTPDMREKHAGRHRPIKNEANAILKNKRGTITMARKENKIDSAVSEFLINAKDNDFLDHKDETSQGYGYAVFGKVMDSMDVVDRISKVRVSTIGPYTDVPAKPVLIESIKFL